MNFSIVIPCYNEEKNISLILDKFQKCINRNDIEVILVNNGSSDNTADLLEKTLPQYPFAREVTVCQNQGYGYGILQGLKAAKGNFIGWTHADMQTDPADVIKAVNIIENNNYRTDIYVKGSRKNRPLIDHFFSLGMSIFETLYLKKALFEINAQPNFFSKQFFDSWENPPLDFSLDLYALYMAKKNNLYVIYFNVLFPERIHGTSTWNTGFTAKWRFIKRTVSFSRKLKNGGIK